MVLGIEKHPSLEIFQCWTEDQGVYYPATWPEDPDWRYRYRSWTASMSNKPIFVRHERQKKGYLRAIPVPDNFLPHRIALKAVRDAFREVGVFQGEEKCWEWQFQSISVFDHDPRARVGFIYKKNPRKEVLCEVIGDYGQLSRMDKLDRSS
ncbi:hypothetical protein BT63DRAFT_443634 [Microthyrium microscopicum]|uniref:Uncharacterized protein n=1 Tax=Microthyrium microscopicum TaxID=703497 RepID=A0A6A6TWU0_9PEZI|nr:hypothetical protein BT63DRAFT_443634 [Microthyrium microscopicum]